MYDKCCFVIRMEACVERRPSCYFLGCFWNYFQSFVVLITERLNCKCRDIFRSRGCLGCCSEAPLVISVDEPSKGLKIKGQRVKKKRSVTEDFWSPTSGDMDNSAFPSHRSISSISTSNQTLDTLSNADGTTNPSEYVNHGLLLWNQTRQLWVGIKGSQKSEQTREPKMSWNATYESLLGTNKPFPQPIPLAEMVDFLVDVWEQEGLYD